MVIIAGFGGLTLTAEEFGAREDPAVVLLPSAGRTGDIWRDAAIALGEAGRHAIALDLRGHDDGGGADFATHVADVRAVLAHLPTRPVLAGIGSGASLALAALEHGGEALASGLVLVDHAPWPDGDAPEIAAAAVLSLPLLIARGRAANPIAADALSRLRAQAPNAEIIDVAESGGERADAFNAALLEFLERRAPRAPLVYEAGSDARTLRDALGCFATGVVVAAALDPSGAPQGLTVNSFSSVSLDPPLVLFCLAKGAQTLDTFERAGVFAVNVLHIGQQPTSVRFSTRAGDRFADTAWETWDARAPIISGSLASFECEKYGWHDGGDHVIVVGRVLRARYAPQRDPLLYFRGKYRRLHLA